MCLVLGHGQVGEGKVPRGKVHVLEQVLHGVEEQGFVTHNGLNNIWVAMLGMVMLVTDASEHAALLSTAGLDSRMRGTNAVGHVVCHHIGRCHGRAG